MFKLFVIFYVLLHVNIVSSRTIEFAGYEWEVRSYGGGPGNGCWTDSSSSVWLNGNDLHLKIRRINGEWCQVQVETTGIAKYGRYTFKVDSRLDQLDPNVVLGLFAYKDDSKEIDIEFTGGFYGGTNKRGYYVVQPSDPGFFDCIDSNHVCNFPVSLSGGFTSHSFDWNSNKIEFDSWHGHCSSPPCGGVIKNWEYSEDQIPSQSHDLIIIINFWVANGADLGSTQEVIIKDFSGNVTRPDLRITQSGSITNPIVDESFQLRATVNNNGEAESAPTILRYFLSNDSTINNNDTQLSTDTIVRLSPGQSSSQSDNVSISQIGTYWVGACVANVIGEADVNNNCSNGIEVEVQEIESPDLIVVSPFVDNTQVSTDQFFTVGGTVENIGNVDAASTRLRYYISTDAFVDDNDTELDSDFVSSLSPNEQSAENDQVSYPQPGTYWVGSCVDHVNNESNTDNNCSSSTQIEIIDQAFADLTVIATSLSNNTPDTDQTFSLGGTVKNIGDANSSNTTLRYYLSLDSIIDSSDIELSTDSISALSPDQISIQNDNLSLPNPGSFWVGSCVDVVGNETIINNNCSVGRSISVNDTPHCNYTLVWPNGGEEILRNSAATITWQYEGNDCDAFATIELHHANTNLGILGTVLNSNGEFIWHVPQHLGSGDEYHISLRYMGEPTYVDVSNQKFTITSTDVIYFDGF